MSHTKVLPNLYIGDLQESRKRHIQYDLILNYTETLHPINNDIVYIHMPCIDSTDFNIFKYFIPSCTLINLYIKTNKKVLIHCHAGVSRSATIIIAYLMFTGMSYASALKYLEQKRPIINPNEGFRLQLHAWEKELKMI